MDREAWRATVHGATESAISEHIYIHACCNAGDAGSTPGQGPKIPYAEE